MFEQILGSEMPTTVRFIIAFGIVLSLIVLTFVGLRRFAGRRLPLSGAGRARQPRLGVLDAFAIDARRRLVLIRRDNVEHLIMIGGPNDVLVESEIVRAPAQAQIAPQRAQRAPGENTRAAVAPPERNLARALPPPEQAHAPAPQHREREPEPAPVTPAAFRNAFPPRPAQRPAAPVANNPPPPPPRAPARPQRMEPELTEAPAPPARPKAEIDPLYADIERKLGEALSRPASAPPMPPAPTRSAPPPPPARAPAPPPPPVRASAPPPARSAAPPPPPRRAAEPPAPKAGRNHLDALEEEMASLLGRDRTT